MLSAFEVAQRRLDDASAQLHALEATPPGAAREAARRALHQLLIEPLTPLHHVTFDAIAESLGRDPAEASANATAVGDLASALQEALQAGGAPTEALTTARDGVHPLSEEYNGKLWCWVRERQVAALHAWACALGVKLHLAAYGSKEDFLAAVPPMSSQLVMGMDLDPASTDDFRHVVAQTLAPDGFLVAGIQQTESDAAGEPAEAEGPPPPPPPVLPQHVGHTHNVRGNAYNFASTPQHATSFDLVGGQLGGVPCFRVEAGAPLGCVEAAYNWFASMCSWGPHLGNATQVSAALAEYTAGWPIGGLASERCAAQRHFHGFLSADAEDAEAAHGNVRNMYLLRQLMGFCMFHGCKQVGDLGKATLDGKGVAARDIAGAEVLLFV